MTLVSVCVHFLKLLDTQTQKWTQSLTIKSAFVAILYLVICRKHPLRLLRSWLWRRSDSEFVPKLLAVNWFGYFSRFRTRPILLRVMGKSKKIVLGKERLALTSVFDFLFVCEPYEIKVVTLIFFFALVWSHHHSAYFLILSKELTKSLMMTLLMIVSRTDP